MVLCGPLSGAEELLVPGAGRTRDEALANIREAIELYLEPDPEFLVEHSRQEIVELAL